MCYRIQKGYLRWALFCVAALLLPAASPAFGQTMLINVDPAGGCAQNINTPGEYVLTGDLNCGKAFGNGINITASDVIFHLAGHTISSGHTILSGDCDLTVATSGISVPGGVSNVQIDGGTVSGFNEGILLYASNSHVRGIRSTDSCSSGIAISGTGNRVDTSVVTGSPDGIGIGSASGTVIVANDISSNFRAGVAISNSSNSNTVAQNILNNNGLAAVAVFSGENNIISDNTANYNFYGIKIDWPNNFVDGNTVNGSAGNGASGIGIAIGPDGASTEHRNNRFLGSSQFDVSDNSPGCGPGTWDNDTFQTGGCM